MPYQSPLLIDYPEPKPAVAEFAGWEVPLFFQGILPEALNVRTKAGLFDASHMGKILATGPAATDFLESMLVSSGQTLPENQGRYTFICNEKGGIEEDLIFFRLAETAFFTGQKTPGFLLIINAANHRKITDLLARKAAEYPNFSLHDRTFDYGLLALQGPNTEQILRKTGVLAHLDGLRKYQCGAAEIDGIAFWATRSGYTGEDGFEFIVSRNQTMQLWQTILRHGRDYGLVPAGLGARDTLRIEAGLPLYGHEIHTSINPFQAGYGWTVHLIDDEGKPRRFPGRDALAALMNREPDHKPVRLKLKEKGIPREGCLILFNKQEAGLVTSGTFSPNLKCGVALGFLETAVIKDKILELLEIRVRENLYKAEIF